MNEERIGDTTGMNTGKSNTGNRNDLCFAYIEKADMSVPAIARSRIGNTKPPSTNIETVEKENNVISGREMNKLKITCVCSLFSL